MGLSLQLFVTLSKLLEQHSNGMDSDIAKHLVDLAKQNQPELLERNDPSNAHTSVLCALALGLGLEESKEPEQQLVLSNALEWVLHKMLMPTVLVGLDQNELDIVNWARKAQSDYNDRLEHIESTSQDQHGITEKLWAPNEDRVRGEAIIQSIDPMLVPDVSQEKLQAFSQTHNTGEREAPIRYERKQKEPEPEAPAVSLPLSRKDNMFLKPRDEDLIQITETATSEVSAPVETPSTGLIQVTGYDSTAPEVITARKDTDWTARLMAIASLGAPPMALYCAGYAVGKKQPGRAAGFIALGLVGWILWTMAF